MSSPAFHHVGLLVRDIELAVARFSHALGISFKKPATMSNPHLETRHRPGPQHVVTSYTFSIEGPPYIELIEAQGDELYGLHQGEGFHHLAIFVPEPERYCNALVEEGLVGFDGRGVRNGRTDAWFSDPASLHGVRVEFCNAEFRDQLELILGMPELPTGIPDDLDTLIRPPTSGAEKSQL